MTNIDDTLKQSYTQPCHITRAPRKYINNVSIELKLSPNYYQPHSLNKQGINHKNNYLQGKTWQPTHENNPPNASQQSYALAKAFITITCQTSLQLIRNFNQHLEQDTILLTSRPLSSISKPGIHASSKPILDMLLTPKH